MDRSNSHIYSVTSSARPTVGGISMPRAFVFLRSIASSYFVGDTAGSWCRATSATFGSRLSPASRGVISWGGWRAEIFASTTAGLPATRNGGFSVHLSAGITSGLASFAHPVYLTPSCFDQLICPRSKSLVLEFPRWYSSLVG